MFSVPLLSEGTWDREARKGESTQNFKINPSFFFFYKSQQRSFEFWKEFN